MSMYCLQPDFSDKPLNTEEDVNDWLTFHDMRAPLICLTEFVSLDPVSVRLAKEVMVHNYYGLLFFLL